MKNNNGTKAPVIAAILSLAILLLPLGLQAAEATHFHGTSHFPNAYLHEQDGDYVKLRQISYFNSAGETVYKYQGSEGEDHNSNWGSQTTLRFGSQFSLMIPQPKDGSLKMPTDISIIIQGPGNNDDFAYDMQRTGWIQRIGDVYKFNGYQRITFMLDSPAEMSEEDWTVSERGKGKMLLWLDMEFEDGTSMRYLLVAKIIGQDCEQQGWSTSASRTSCFS